jgi:hypothetical protein
MCQRAPSAGVQYEVVPRIAVQFTHCGALYEVVHVEAENAAIDRELAWLWLRCPIAIPIGPVRAEIPSPRTRSHSLTPRRGWRTSSDRRSADFHRVSGSQRETPRQPLTRTSRVRFLTMPMPTLLVPPGRDPRQRQVPPTLPAPRRIRKSLYA